MYITAYCLNSYVDFQLSHVLLCLHLPMVHCMAQDVMELAAVAVQLAPFRVILTTHFRVQVMLCAKQMDSGVVH